jgi:GH35 family endo-1,4-beta-xylanase
MKNKLLLILLLILLTTLLLTSCSLLFMQPESSGFEPTEPSGCRLRIIVEDKYPDGNIIIGGTTGSWAFGTNTGLILDREFSYVTPENDFKQAVIHPDPTSWNWTQSDEWVQHIIDNNQILRMHCPIGPQCSEWAKDDIRTAKELEINLREFLQAVCERYNGRSSFEYMDVVNETVIQGAWNTDQPGTNWECPWYKIGQDNDENNTPLYIKIAFEIAQKYAPDIKFIYNHHDCAFASWELIKETIIYLRNNGLRVDGIGWQAHVDDGWATTENLNGLRNMIDWAHNNDLEFHITEASVWLKNGNSQAALEEQAATYRAIIEVLLEKCSTGKVGWNIWHIDDAHGWHTEWYPSLFDINYSAKLAYYAIQEALESAD